MRDEFTSLQHAIAAAEVLSSRSDFPLRDLKILKGKVESLIALAYKKHASPKKGKS